MRFYLLIGISPVRVLSTRRGCSTKGCPSRRSSRSSGMTGWRPRPSTPTPRGSVRRRMWWGWTS